MIEAGDIKGIKGLYAFKALQTLLLSYYMLPEFRKEKETYAEFLKRFNDMAEDEKREILRTSLYFAGIEEKEIFALVAFAKDKNGIHYQPANVANLEIKELFDIIIDVCMAILSIDVFFNENELKKIPNGSGDIVGAVNELMKTRGDLHSKKQSINLC